MAKKEPIYEKKTDKRKSKSISIRTTVEIAAQIDEKAEQAGLNRNDYISTACQQCQIIVIPEGQTILQVVQETRNMIRTLHSNPTTKDTDALLGKVVAHLRNLISHNPKDR